MARIGYDDKEVVEWIPPGEELEDKPFTVLMTHVNFKRVQAYSKRIGSRVAAQSKGVKDFSKINEITTRVTEEIQKEQFCENVKGIKNYLTKGREITAPEEFYDVADNPTMTEIFEAMESSAKLSAGQVKNSSGESNGNISPVESTDSPSTAQSVTSQTKKIETAETG